MTFVALLAAVIVALLVFRPIRASRGVRVAWSVLAVVGPLAVAALLAWRWYYHRPQPGSLAPQALFRGISYEREVRTSPRPIVLHVVTIDLRDPGISFLVTPLDAQLGGVMRAATTSEFLTRYHVQLAINGDFFLPWWSDGPTDTYPHSGDPTDVLGAAVSGKDSYGWRVTPYSALVVGPTGKVSIVEMAGPDAQLPPARMVISGKQIVVRGGARTAACSASEQARVPHPRTAAALDRTGKKLLLFVVDGRQRGYSEGATLDDLATLVLEHGGYLAMNMDGGGSSTLAIDDREGESRVLNCPFHTRIPWRERAVANHFGVLAQPLPQSD